MTKFIRIMDELNEVFTTGLLADFIPIFRYIPTKGLTNFHESIDSLHKMVKDVYEEHRKTFDECEYIRLVIIREGLLIMGRGTTKREVGASEVFPLQKCGGRKSFSHAEDGAQKVLR